MRNLSISLAVAMAVAAAATPTWATGYTFTANNGASGSWDDANNWDPVTGPPGSGDTATIPNGKLCRVDQDNQEADSIDVQSGATLEIINSVTNGPSLAITDNSTINGYLYFTGTHAILTIAADLTISGTGTITVSDRANDTGHILSVLISSLNKLTIGAGITVVGSVNFLVDLDNDGTFIVNNSNDYMNLGCGAGCAELTIEGEGKYDVSAGTLHISQVSFTGIDVSSWGVTGGKLLIHSFCAGCDDFGGELTLSGGTLDVDADLCTEHNFKFNNCTIEVASGVTAAFHTRCN